MSKQDLFKQAIAEARELKEISMAQAKQQIAEAFAPRISEMFKMKVNELEEAELEEVEKMEEGEMEEGMKKMDEVDEASLDEILAELEGENLEEEKDLEEESLDLEENMDLEEAKKKADDKKEDKKDDKKDDKKEDKKDAPKKDAAPKAPKADDGDDLGSELDLGTDADLGMDDMAGAEGGEDITELSVEEFKNLVRDVVADVLAGNTGGEEMPMDDMGAEPEMGADAGMSDVGGEAPAGDDEAISLDEILAELEEEGMEMEEEGFKAPKSHGFTDDHGADHASFEPEYMHGDDEETDELGDFDFDDEEDLPGSKKFKRAVANDRDTFFEKKEKDLEEAMKTIEELRSQINETNLFNAKMLYTNKIFEAKNLTQSQKAKVLNAFDKASSLNEVKSIYKALTTTLDSSKKTTIKESMGFASKPMGSAPAKPIVEANDAFTRMQQLAGIKKIY